MRNPITRGSMTFALVAERCPKGFDSMKFVVADEFGGNVYYRGRNTQGMHNKQYTASIDGASFQAAGSPHEISGSDVRRYRWVDK